MFKQNKGITLIVLVITIIILMILTSVTITVGYGTYKDMLLTAYVSKMNMVQSRVNLISQKIEEGDTSYNTIGTEINELTSVQQEKVNIILEGMSSKGFKYYTQSDLEQLGVEGIDEEVIINLETREIFSMIGIKYNNIMYYNQYDLPNGAQRIEYDELQTKAPEFTIEKDNYGLTTTVNITNIVYDEQINGSDIYYGEVIDETTNPLTVSFWKQISGTSFSVTKTAKYAVKMKDRNGGETIKTVDVTTCNAPELVEGMVPVIYEDGNWKKVEDNEIGKWYDYAEKKWANIMLKDGLEIADDGTVTSMGSMFVWIPRYAYSITSGYQTEGTGTIDVRFLKNLTYVTTEEKTTVMSDEAGANNWIVHPAFTDGSENDYAEGGWDRELAGFWVAKFEASGVDKDGTAVGVSSESTSTTSYARFVPEVQSWRYITVGEAQYKSMKMDEDTVYGWKRGSTDSHLIKNDEWGAVAYLCYSKYGEVPKTNGASDYYTGAGPYSGTTKENANENGVYTYTSEHAYNTMNGVLASTTGNVYGIYDMAGGNWEVISEYLDNGNTLLEGKGKSKTDTNVAYFEKKSNGNVELKDEYKKYWSKYEVEDEEKNNSIKINDTTTLNQSQLWNTENNSTEHNAAKLRLTTGIYNKMANHKGIGINEVASSFSYYGINSTKNWSWFTNETQPNTNTTTYGQLWDKDSCLIGHAYLPFAVRGGFYGDKARAGVFASSGVNGSQYGHIGFRTVFMCK